MQRSRKQVHERPNNPEADTPPCCMTLVTAPATHVQRQAWACLWRTLLREDVDSNGRPARTNEGEHHE